jgi:soluble cytochrome b562
MNLHQTLKHTALALLLAAAFAPAKAQSAKDFEEMRAEIKRLREELNELKAAKAPAKPEMKHDMKDGMNADMKAKHDNMMAKHADVVDRLEQVELRAKDAVVLGDIPGSFRLPGSETSLRIYGFAELNAVHEFKGDNGSCDYSTCLFYAPLSNSDLAARKNGTYLHARTSRIGFEAATPTTYGPVSVKIEGDFNNDPRTGNAAVNGDYKNIYTQQATNSYNFRLRQAYGQFGGLLAGQTWSTFFDVDNMPETVDFNGPIGSTFIRQPMIRYAYATKSNGTFTAAIENPASYVYDNTGSGVPSKSGFSRVPDLVGRWDRSFDWGAMSVRGVVHELLLKDQSANLSVSTLGWGVGFSGAWKASADDLVNWQFTAGEGIGRYFNYIEGAVYDPSVNRILKERVFGLVVGMQHKFSSELRFNGSLGVQRTANNEYTRFALDPANKLDSAGLGNYAINRSVWQTHLGFIWNPVKNVDFGSEWIFGKRKTLRDETGDANRFNLSAKYYFN